MRPSITQSVHLCNSIEGQQRLELELPSCIGPEAATFTHMSNLKSPEIQRESETCKLRISMLKASTANHLATVLTLMNRTHL